ncbi:protein translocase subunit SecF [uncultured Treponema sp.]|uniref:protein translocase subunit SecF n=1 Tax=uncultured Treponema sp. TaxID=162155 RepID=UPI0015BEB781|nr:protein translocase subunit SecF [uncultured Treponema sp.]
MKKLIHFSKFFPVAVVLSTVLILSGIVSLCVRGMNWGLEFKPGQNIQVSVNAQTDADEISGLLSEKKVNASVKSAGGENSYQIRTESGESVENAVKAALSEKYGSENVAVEQSQSISAQFSKSLIRDSIVLVLATLVLIFAYTLFRFKWDAALGSVIAVIHDALIMISFFSWSQLEFTTTSIAAILTIIGYSINATVVILDRVRSDMKIVEAKSFKDILNSSLTSTLSRSVITTVTTLFAVLSLVVFTTGDIKNFAIALVVGLISGCYSSLFIAGAFISLVRKNWKPVAVLPKASLAADTEEKE